MYLNEVVKILGVSRATVRYWAKVGRIRTSKGIATNKLIYWDDDVWALVGKRLVRDHRVVAYCRVDGTTEKKRETMQRQQEKISLFATARGLSIDEVYEDWSPSVVFDPKARPGLHSLLVDIIQGKIQTVIVETHDRLARVGWELFPTLFAYYGVELVVMNKAIKLAEYQEEQERDLQWILQRAGVDRIDALGADLKPKPKKQKPPTVERKAPYWRDADPDMLSDLI
jgi:predicted site-specific integrase-resolvase